MDEELKAALTAAIIGLHRYTVERAAPWTPPERSPDDIEGRVHDLLQFRGGMPHAVKRQILAVNAVIRGLEAVRDSALDHNTALLDTLPEDIIGMLEGEI